MGFSLVSFGSHYTIAFVSQYGSRLLLLLDSEQMQPRKTCWGGQKISAKSLAIPPNKDIEPQGFFIAPFFFLSIF